MKDWTNLSKAFKQIVDDAMADGHHHNFETRHDFLNACVEYYMNFEEEFDTTLDRNDDVLDDNDLDDMLLSI